MRNTRFVLLAAAMTAVLAMSGCSKKDTEKEQTDALQTESAAGGAEAESMPEAADAAAMAADALENAGDIQMDASLSLSASISGDSGASSDIDTALSIGMTRIGNVIHMTGETDPDGMGTGGEWKSEAYAIADGSGRAYFKDQESGQWHASDEEYSLGAGAPFHAAAGLIREADDISDDGDRYCLSGTADIADVPFVKDYAGPLGALLGAAGGKAVFTCMVDKDGFLPDEISCVYGGENRMGNVSIQEASAHCTFSWPAEGPDRIPEEVLAEAGTDTRTEE